jgi:hypothetical protein
MAANGQNHAVSVQNQVPMDTDDGSQAREPADLPPSAPPDIAHGLPHELLLAAAGDIEDAAAAGEKQALLTRVAYLLIPGKGNCTTAGQGSELGHLYLDTLEAAWMAVDSVLARRDEITCAVTAANKELLAGAVTEEWRVTKLGAFGLVLADLFGGMKCNAWDKDFIRGAQAVRTQMNKWRKSIVALKMPLREVHGCT